MKASGYYFVYIISNATHTTIYIGITNDLERRLYEHRSKEVKGFSARYRLTDLVYYESFPDPVSAIAREKQLKGWRREKKEKLIERLNPGWHDLSASWNEPPSVS